MTVEIYEIAAFGVIALFLVSLFWLFTLELSKHMGFRQKKRPSRIEPEEKNNIG